MGHFIVGLLLTIIIINSGWFIFLYNKISNKKAEIEDNLGQINELIRQSQYLVLNYVETICSSAVHKEKMLGDLPQLRNELLNAQTSDESKKTSKEIIELMNRLSMDKGGGSDIEAEYDLLHMWHQIEELGGKIASKQQVLCEEVFLYNKTVNIFPNAIAARIMDIKEIPWDDLWCE